jgi:lipopolysaccharide/colanic/teichoic acid biosynthesis glycosyltransferase
MANMGFGGPRSARLNQDDLRSLPTAAGVHCLVPGLTGWAPVHGGVRCLLRQQWLWVHSMCIDTAYGSIRGWCG